MNRRKKEKIGLGILEIVMLLLSLLVIVPLLIMIFGSFKSPAEAAKFNIKLPSSWSFRNYSFVFQNGGIARAALNSIFITAVSVILIVSISVLCSFVIARKRSSFTKAIYNVFLMGMIAPMQLIPTFGLLKMLNLVGTYTGVILLFCATQIPWAVFILTGFMKTIPRELDEAAFIDGAGPIRMIVSIIFPLLKPVIATAIAIFSMSVWNDIMIPLFFLTDASKTTIPLTVYNFFGQYLSNWNYVFADMVFTVVPILALYLGLQKYVVAGMTAGSVKG